MISKKKKSCRTLAEGSPAVIKVELRAPGLVLRNGTLLACGEANVERAVSSGFDGVRVEMRSSKSGSPRGWLRLELCFLLGESSRDEATGALMGVVRLHTDANHHEGEYAILLRSDLKGRGLGWALMQMMIDYARADGLAEVRGQILRENTTMLAMCAALGFDSHPDPDDHDIRNVVLKLT